MEDEPREGVHSVARCLWKRVKQNSDKVARGEGRREIPSVPFGPVCSSL